MPGDSPPTRILVIEDERDTVAMLRVLLEPRGYTVRVCSDGLSGLAAAQSESFALIILDVSLPGLSGDEIVTHLKRDKRTANVPIMVLTSRADSSDRVRLFEHGVDDYIVRPSSPLELLSRIQSLIKRSTEMPSEDLGRLVVFLGCAGGVGTTTLCANVAQALGARARTVAIDAGWPLGALTHLLAVPPQAGLQQIAAEDITPELLNTYLAGGRAGIRFRYLNGFDSIAIDDYPEVNIVPILQSARTIGRYVLVDAGDGSAPFVPAIVQQADLAVVVMALERTHITQMRTYVSYLDKLGLRRNRRILVGNRLRPSPFGIRDIQRLLEEDVFLIIPYEANRLSQCLAEGRLLLTQYPSSAGAIAIAELAATLSREIAVEA